MLKKLSNILCFFKYVIHTKKWHHSDRIYNPLSIDGLKNIELGQNVTIKDHSFIIALPMTGEKECRLVIEDNTRIQFGVHIVATKSVVIGKNCNFSPNVYISDNAHGYEDVTKAPMYQRIKQLKETEIGDDTWIGRNVCVYGCKVGKHCVIAANSVVNRDVPDFSVVAGSPARIVKRYDFETKQWRKTDGKGNF